MTQERAGNSLQRTFAEFDKRMRTSFNEEGQIYNALGLVTPHQRHIFRLRLGLMSQVNEGQPWNRRQVGEYLGLKPSSVGSAERRGLRTLRAFGFPENPIAEEFSQTDPDRSKRILANVLAELNRPLIARLRRHRAKG